MPLATLSCWRGRLLPGRLPIDPLPSTSSSSTGRPWRTSRSPSQLDIHPTASTSSTSEGASVNWRWGGSARPKRLASTFHPAIYVDTHFVMGCHPEKSKRKLWTLSVAALAPPVPLHQWTGGPFFLQKRLLATRDNWQKKCVDYHLLEKLSFLGELVV